MLNLTRVAGLTVDVARAGLASLSASTINAVTDTLAQITLAALPLGTTVLLDGRPTGPTVTVPVGQHTITLTVEASSQLTARTGQQSGTPLSS